MKKWKLDRIISVATLVTSVIALFLVLKRPAPVAVPQPAAAAAVNAQSFQEKFSNWISLKSRVRLQLKFASILTR